MEQCYLDAFHQGEYRRRDDVVLETAHALTSFFPWLDPAGSYAATELESLETTADEEGQGTEA